MECVHLAKDEPAHKRVKGKMEREDWLNSVYG